MKKYLKRLFIIGLIVLISGCIEKHDNDDVKLFIATNIGITDYSISNNYTEHVDEDGYKDKLWKVHDNKNDFDFYVIDDYHWGYESVSNSLKSNYYDAFYLKERKNIKTDYKITYINNSEYDGYDNITLKCEFNDRYELEKCYKSLSTISNYFGNKSDISYMIKYTSTGAIPGDIKDNSIDEFGVLYGMESEFDHLLNKYLYFGISNNIDSIISDMTKEEYKSVIDSNEAVRVYKYDDDKPKNLTKKYDDIYVNMYTNQISVSSLYKLFKAENYNVVGDLHNYKLYYNDITYEFADDFIEYNDKNEPEYYYIENGYKKKFSEYYSLDRGFNQFALEKIFNLKVHFIDNEHIGNYNIQY